MDLVEPPQTTSHRRIGGHFADDRTSEDLHPWRTDQASAVDTHISCAGFGEVVALGVLVRDLERKAVVAMCRFEMIGKNPHTGPELATLSHMRPVTPQRISNYHKQNLLFRMAAIGWSGASK